MKTNVRIIMNVNVLDDEIIGGYNEHMGHGTSLCVGGQPQYDNKEGELKAYIPKNGDHIIFSIPSGDFEGHVINTYTDPETDELIISMYGSWEGQYYGLSGGRSSYGRFQYIIDDCELIESSWGNMEYREYLLIRQLRDNTEVAESAIETYRKIMIVDNNENKY